MAQEQYGITTVVANITIESESIVTNPIKEPVPNQTNATVNEIKYDTRTDLSLTYRGTKLAEENGIVTYNGVKYSVDSHEEAGTYNGLKRYNLRAHKFENFPSQA